MGMKMSDDRGFQYLDMILPFIIGLAFGFVKFMGTLRKTGKFCWVCLIVDVLLAGLISVSVFMGLTAISFPDGLAAAIGGIAAHGGARSVFIIEKLILQYARASFRHPEERAPERHPPPDDVN